MPWDKTQNLAGPQGPAGIPADTSAFVKIAGDTMQGPLVVPNATAGTQALNANTADTAYLQGFTAATSTGVGDVQYAAESGLLTGIKMRQFAVYGSTNNDGVFYGATTGFSGAALITVCPVIAVGGLLFSTYLWAPRIISTNGKSCGHKNAAMEAATQENIESTINEFPLTVSFL